MSQFQAASDDRVAQCWVSSEPNQPVRPGKVEQPISVDFLVERERRSGLPRAEIVERLATGPTETVNKLTP